jgi:hypothetical protein
VGHKCFTGTTRRFDEIIFLELNNILGFLARAENPKIVSQGQLSVLISLFFQVIFKSRLNKS